MINELLIRDGIAVLTVRYASLRWVYMRLIRIVLSCPAVDTWHGRPGGDDLLSDSDRGSSRAFDRSRTWAKRADDRPRVSIMHAVGHVGL